MLFRSYNDFVNSQLLVYKDAGWLGDGIATSKYVSGVVKFRRGTDTSRVVAPSLRLFIVYLSSVFRAMNGVTPSHKS